MKEIKRFTTVINVENFKAISIITPKYKHAIVPDGYKKCGKSFLAYFDSEDPPRMSYVEQ